MVPSSLVTLAGARLSPGRGMHLRSRGEDDGARVLLKEVVVLWSLVSWLLSVSEVEAEKVLIYQESRTTERI